MNCEVEASSPFSVGKVILSIAVLVVLLGAPLQPLAPLAYAQRLTLENRDRAPFPDRLVFNRIGRRANPPPNGVHELAKLRLHNTGSAPLQITALSTTGRFAVDTAPTLPANIAPGGFRDVVIRFTSGRGPRLQFGTLVISSNDPRSPTTVVDLAGIWQQASEKDESPFAELIERVFGYGTDVLYDGQSLNNQGRIETVGDEVFSPYWRRADPARPVTVLQIAAFHIYPVSMQVFWHYKGSSNTTQIFRHDKDDSQSVLPRRNRRNVVAYGEFSPSSTTNGGIFGWRIAQEWSDPARNDKSNDDCSGGPSTCGHHVRFWPVKDRAGVVVPNTYFMTMDMAGLNFDYNDNVYIISNIVPESSAIFAVSNADAPQSSIVTEEAPETFVLEGNYPNPFNPQTTIQYALPQAVHVEVEVFDLVGRRVAVLVDGLQEEGRHEVVFNGRDLPSGIYMYRLRAGSVVLTRKMVLMK